MRRLPRWRPHSLTSRQSGCTRLLPSSPLPVNPPIASGALFASSLSVSLSSLSLFCSLALAMDLSLALDLSALGC